MTQAWINELYVAERQLSLSTAAVAWRCTHGAHSLYSASFVVLTEPNSLYSPFVYPRNSLYSLRVIDCTHHSFIRVIRCTHSASSVVLYLLSQLLF